jgi:hypothetical protein
MTAAREDHRPGPGEAPEPLHWASGPLAEVGKANEAGQRQLLLVVTD